MAKPTDCSNGFWIESFNTLAMEIAPRVGLSTAVLDMEHGGGMTASGADSMILVGRSLGLRVLVRVADGSRVAVQHALDSGANGVIIPQIDSAGEAAHASRFCKYPPFGARGIGYGRTMYDGIGADFIEIENQRTECWIMIETAAALDAAGEIAALPCVDGLFVGPADLSLARGRGLYADTEADREDHRRVADAVRAAGKLWAMPAPTAALAHFARAEGASLVVIADDVTALRRGFEAALADTAS